MIITSSKVTGDAANPEENVLLTQSPSRRQPVMRTRPHDYTSPEASHDNSMITTRFPSQVGESFTEICWFSCAKL